MEIIYLTPQADGSVEWPTLSDDKRAVVTVGSFDGVHKGHQAVLCRTVELAREHNSISVAVTFDPRPTVVHEYAASHDGDQLAQGEDYADYNAITSVPNRLEHFEKLGVDYAIVVRYTLELAARTYVYFLGQLVGKLGMRTLVLGNDANMGKKREGDVTAIQRLADGTRVFELEIVDDRGPGRVYIPRQVEYVVPAEAGEPHNPLDSMSKDERRAWSKKNRAVSTRVYSSSMIRFLLARGCAADANDILGYAHAIDAVVEHGQARGRELGFPTANCGKISGFIPVDGVYAGYMTMLDTGERWVAAISVGKNETFDGQVRTVEAHAIMPDGSTWIDLYDRPIRVEFTDFVRPQQRYGSTQELVDQLHEDVHEIMRLRGDAR